jgi:hypothetical protein
MPSPGRKSAGRPPKKGQKDANAPKRGRGRPPKNTPKPPKKAGPQGGAPKGNKNAEKFTEEYVIDLLDSMYRYATREEGGRDSSGKPFFNPVRANDIKLFKELCICVGINSVQFSEIQEKFCRKYVIDNQAVGEDRTRPNQNYSPVVSEKVQTIKDICECRLSYSGQFIDTFLLKNHYGMTDKTDITSQGEKLPAPVAPVINIIEQL